MFFQNWKLSLIAIIMIPLAIICCKIIGKKNRKSIDRANGKQAILNTFLIELFKNHKLIKIFQKENYENDRANKFN